LLENLLALNNEKLEIRSLDL